MDQNNHLLTDYLQSLSDHLSAAGYDRGTRATILASIEHQFDDEGAGTAMSNQAQADLLAKLSRVEDYPPFDESEGDPLDQRASDPVGVAPPPLVSKPVVPIKAVVLLALVLLVLWGVWMQRNLVSKSHGIEAAEAQVDNVLQRRYDLIPNLVATVKGSATHERELLAEVVRLRSDWARQTGAKKQEAGGLLENALGRLLVNFERYPDLKANAAFRDLMVSLEGSENRIAIERRRLNETVRVYNATIQKFPDRFVAAAMGYSTREDYFSKDEAAAVAPKVEF